MKPLSCLRPPLRLLSVAQLVGRVRRPRGMALVIVLSAMALLMVLILAMLVTGRTETRSAAAFSRSVEVRSLADLPVNIVMAQIRKATSGLGTQRTWTSQPGMIRVYGTETGSDGRSKLVSGWKLYSSDDMVTGADFSAAAEANAMQNWKDQPAIFTDLNQPVAVPVPGGGVRRVFPIFDPAAIGKVEGAAISSDNGSAPGATREQPVPMPVRWLYLLQDGSLVAPTGGTGTKLTFSASVVTRDNPIVGRIAFWTDDESCKVNINTASEGTPWDTPRATSWTERNYGIYLPAQNEFQRYPGHPAMTCLSTVLQAFDERYKPLPPGIDANGDVTNPNYVPFLGGIYAMMPRTNHGVLPGESSKGGSQVAGQDPATKKYLVDPVTGKDAALPIKRERLFATVDELFYAPNRVASPGLEPEELQTARFFLTAHSRAPETNLFNRPRISLWPLQAASDKRNAKDKLIAFCSTVAGQECGFQRATTFTGPDGGLWGSSQSTTQDLNLSQNQRVLSYIANLTSKSVPGFGSDSFAQKYGQMNHAQIMLSMFDLTRWGVNSYANALPVGASKNGYNYLPPRNRSSTNSKGYGEFSAVPVAASAMPGSASALPVSLKTFGRFPTVVEATFVFMATKVATETNSKGEAVPIDKVDNITGEAKPDNWADSTLEMQAFLILQPFSPTVGTPAWSANVRYVANGLESLEVDGASLGFPSRCWHRVRCNFTTASDGGGYTSFTGMNSQFLQSSGSGKALPPLRRPGNEDTSYEFVSVKIPVLDKKEFVFEGGQFSLEVRTGFPNSVDESELVQTLHFSFPPTTLRVPRVGKLPTQADWKAATDSMNLQQRLSKAWQRNDNDPWRDGRRVVIGRGDMARSLVVDTDGPSKGDLRLIAALSEVPANFFTPHPDYANTSKEEAQSLRHPSFTLEGYYGTIHSSSDLPSIGGRQHAWQMAGYSFSGGTIEKAFGLLRDVPYWQDCVPAVPMRLNGALNANTRPGDWDNGMGRVEDGAYINKPDESNLDATSDSRHFARNSQHFATEGIRSFAPNRQICSAVAFGSLPTGVHPVSGNQRMPWQTLLFCPNPPSRTTAADKEPVETDHYGFKAPRDHLWLDLFWMPVVDPYAISEPLSTAGKVNMNAQMMPFSYIERNTALHAALRSVRVSAMPSKLAWAGNATTTSWNDNDLRECYKSNSSSTWLKYDTLYEVNAAETMKGFKQRFDKNDVFRSASEICDIFLVPKPTPNRDYPNAPGSKPTTIPEYKGLTEWWNGDLGTQSDGFELTGDNTRESPYNQLYPRLTTRSNVFQVHYRVQIIQKSRSSAPNEWDESAESHVAETRGSTIIERYADPNDPTLPNFVESPDTPDALDDHYRFRVIRQKQFAP
jgi:uncharacterized protein (TIGR02600 family)